MELEQRTEFITSKTMNKVHFKELLNEITRYTGLYLSNKDFEIFRKKDCVIATIQNVKLNEYGSAPKVYNFHVMMTDYSCILSYIDVNSGEVLGTLDLTEPFIKKMLGIFNSQPAYAAILYSALRQSEAEENQRHKSEIARIKGLQKSYFGDTISNIETAALQSATKRANSSHGQRQAE